MSNKSAVSMRELEGESADLLPTRETLQVMRLHPSWGWHHHHCHHGWGDGGYGYGYGGGYGYGDGDDDGGGIGVILFGDGD